MNKFVPKDAGELAQRITLLRRTAAPSGAADATDTYAEIARNVSAKLEPLVGVHYVAGAQTEQRITHRATVRWRPSIKPGAVATGALYFDFSGRRFRVHNVLDEGEGRTWLKLEAEEIRSGV